MGQGCLPNALCLEAAFLLLFLFSAASSVHSANFTSTVSKLGECVAAAGAGSNLTSCTVPVADALSVLAGALDAPAVITQDQEAVLLSVCNGTSSGCLQSYAQAVADSFATQSSGLQCPEVPAERAADVMAAAAQFACLAPPDGREGLPATCGIRVAQAIYSADPALLTSLKQLNDSWSVPSSSLFRLCQRLAPTGCCAQSFLRFAAALAESSCKPRAATVLRSIATDCQSRYGYGFLNSCTGFTIPAALLANRTDCSAASDALPPQAAACTARQLAGDTCPASACDTLCGLRGAAQAQQTGGGGSGEKTGGGGGGNSSDTASGTTRIVVIAVVAALMLTIAGIIGWKLRRRIVCGCGSNGQEQQREAAAAMAEEGLFGVASVMHSAASAPRLAMGKTMGKTTSRAAFLSVNREDSSHSPRQVSFSVTGRQPSRSGRSISAKSGTPGKGGLKHTASDELLQLARSSNSLAFHKATLGRSRLAQQGSQSGGNSLKRDALGLDLAERASPRVISAVHTNNAYQSQDEEPGSPPSASPRMRHSRSAPALHEAEIALETRDSDSEDPRLQGERAAPALHGSQTALETRDSESEDDPRRTGEGVP